MTHYEFHEYANIFPILEGDELEALRADIDENGQINRIILYQGKILDGRNRYTACEMLSIEPETLEYTGDDPLGLVLSQNLRRRHLTTGQRADIADELANMPVGNPKLRKDAITENSVIGISQAEAGKRLNVSVDSIQQMRKVKEHGTPELVDRVRSGKLAVSTAAALAEKTPDQQRETLAKCEQDGSGRLGKDGKLRPAKYAPRKKTVAKTEVSETLEEQGEATDFLKIPLPLDHMTMACVFGRRFQRESQEVKEQVLREIDLFYEIIQNLRCD